MRFSIRTLITFLFTTFLFMCLGAYIVAKDIESKKDEKKEAYKIGTDDLQYKYIEIDSDIDEATIMLRQKGLYGKNTSKANEGEGGDSGKNWWEGCMCQLMQECRVKTCIYYCDCDNNNMPYIKYVFDNYSMQEAYLSRLEIATSRAFLEPTLPLSDTTIENENIKVEYKWEGDSNLSISMYENNVLVGNLIFEKKENQLTIYDNLSWVK